jgi:tetratricopeptide (TPR) repeat protein
MAHARSRSRRCALAALLAAHFLAAADFLAAQESSKWDQDFGAGVQAYEAGRYAQAIDALTAALADAQEFPALDPRRADAAHLLGMSYQFRGGFDQAEQYYRQARRIRESNGEAGRKELGITLDAIAQLRFEQERWKDAEEMAQQAFTLCSETRGENDPCALNARRHLGEIYATQGRLAEAGTIFAKVIQEGRRGPGLAPHLLQAALRDQGLVLVAKSEYRLAEPFLKEALGLSARLGEGRSETADNLVVLARIYRAEGDSARAGPALERAAAIYEKNDDPCLAHALHELGLIAIAEGKYATARARLLRSIGIYQKFLGAKHVNVAFAEVGLAETYLGERNYAEAQSAIERALEKEKTALNESHIELARAHLTAARISEARRSSSEAAAHYRQAVDIYRRAATSNNPARVMAEKQYKRFSKSFRP